MVVYVISFIDSFAYYAFSYALIIHLGTEVGLPDALAGLFYGIFGVCISVSGVFLGFAVDWLGPRNSICSASAVGFVARLAMAYAVIGRSGWLSTLILCAGVAPCIALMYPPIPIAVKRYTTKDTLDLGMTINYGVMNMGAVVSTGLVELLRLYWGDNVVLMLPPYAMLIAFSGLLQLPIFFAALFGLRDEILSEVSGQVEAYVAPNAGRTLKERMRDVLSQSNFWKAVILVMCLMGAKSSFRYFDALYLPYVTRAYADAATFPYLTLLAMNPAICIASTLTGAITIVTKRLDPVNAMIIGTFIGGIAPFWMALGPFITPIMLYVLFTTLGEIIWATVAYSYFMGLTKTGDEGAYSALAGLPVFLAKLLTGGLTGTLLSRYCPLRFDAQGQVVPPPPPQLWGSPEHCNGLIIWSVIGLTTISSAILLFMCQRKVRYAPVTDEGALVLTDISMENEEDHSDVELQSRAPLIDSPRSAKNFSEMDPIPLNDKDL